MCGIAGVHLKERALPASFNLEEFVDALLLGIEHRGTDATGFVACSKGGKSLTLDKKPMPASHFVLRREAIPRDARTVLLHTRLGTQGTEKDPGNNHPVVAKTTFVTHNGMIQNDYKLFKDFNLKRNAQVDSEIIASLLSECGLDEVKAVSQELVGSFAYAAINPIENPDQLMLVKGGTSPLVYINHPKMIVWASEKQAIELAWGLVIGTPPANNKFKHLMIGDILKINGDEIETGKFKENREAAYGYSQYYSTGWSEWEDWEDYDDHGFRTHESDSGVEDTTEIPSLPVGDGWQRQSNGSWRREKENGIIEIVYPNKDNNHFVRAEMTANGNEMCWICRERAAVATLLDGVEESTWRVPVCLPCLREESEDGESFQNERRRSREQKQKCSDCNQEAGGLELRFGWKRGKDNRTLCVRCERSESNTLTPLSSTNQGHCIVCDVPRAAHETEDGKPICSRCKEGTPNEHTIATVYAEHQMCDGCSVYFDKGRLERTWFGLLCSTCILREDKGAYCAECRDWYPAKKVVLGPDNKARCTDCDNLRIEKAATTPLEHDADNEPDDRLKNYERTASQQRGLYLQVCERVAFELNTTTDFVDWLLRICPKAQFEHDKTLAEFNKQARDSYSFHLEALRNEIKEARK